MQTYNNPDKSDWDKLCVRPIASKLKINAVVTEIFMKVKNNGDAAVKEMTMEYDACQLTDLRVTIGSTKAERRKLDVRLAEAVDSAYAAIRAFHQQQLTMDGRGKPAENTPGVTCWRETRSIPVVGLYVPGGSAPLISTMLMLCIPAQLAGCNEIIVCTPPDKNGTINPAIRYAAAKCGIRAVYSVGGAQAIAAMTFGTDTIPKVDKLFGPGNQYVTAAKEYAQKFGVSIDMPAGPSEVMVIADSTARPDYVAADLLSQAEHGPDSQVVLLTTSKKLQRFVAVELEKQLQNLPRKQIAKQSLHNSSSIYLPTLEKCLMFANTYAPEHLILQIQNPEPVTATVINAGSVFLGLFSPESAGDYTSGPNHTLPTNGWARSYSGLSVADFQKQISFQRLTKSGLQAIAPTVITLADAEGLAAHARAVSIRLQ